MTRTDDFAGEHSAYVAALEAVAEAFGELFILDAGRSAQGRAWVKVDREGFDRVRAARDAVPAAETGSGEATLCVHCDAPIRALADTHCPSCGCPWDGD